MALAVCLTLPIWLVQMAVHTTPYGLGGLYTAMAHAIANDSYRLPVSIPYYGPGGIPFAYPPLGLYLMAGVSQALGISDFAYLRFAPILFVVLSTPFLYRVYQKLSGSSSKAFIALVLVLATPEMILWDAFADGAVRGLALLFTVIGLLAGMSAINDRDTKKSCAAGVLFAAVLMTHLANGIFFLLTLGLFVLIEKRSRTGLMALAWIVVVGIGLASPWWITVVIRHGPGVYLQALHSQTWYLSASHPTELFSSLAAKYAPTSPIWLPEYLLALVGCVWCCLQRRWFLPLWLGLTVLFVPDWQRFEACAVALLSSSVIVDVHKLPAGWSARGWRGRLASALCRLPGACILVWCVTFAWLWAASLAPAISPSDIAAAQWARSHTPPHAHFLILSTLFPQPEWYPYLLHRTPALAEWGAEWTGHMVYQHQLFLEQSDCVREESARCVWDLIRQRHLSVDYAVETHRLSHGPLSQQLARCWTIIYENQGVSIWRVSGLPKTGRACPG